MNYKRFEDLPVWQAAINLAERALKLVDDRSFNDKGDLRNHVQRADVSINNNIARGGTSADVRKLVSERWGGYGL